MTQKEYREILLKKDNEIIELRKKLETEKDKYYNYQQILEDYHITSEDLRKEKEWNKQNVNTIEEQRRIIEKYEKILDKFTINY